MDSVPRDVTLPSLDRKEATYPELLGSDRCRLVVLGVEVGGRWSTEAADFLRLLARAKARAAPAALQPALRSAYVHRWSGLLSAAATLAFAASLTCVPSPGLSKMARRPSRRRSLLRLRALPHAGPVGVLQVGSNSSIVHFFDFFGVGREMPWCPGSPKRLRAEMLAEKGARKKSLAATTSVLCASLNGHTCLPALPERCCNGAGASEHRGAMRLAKNRPPSMRRRDRAGPTYGLAPGRSRLSGAAKLFWARWQKRVVAVQLPAANVAAR